MKAPIRLLLLAGAALVAGTGIAFSQMEPPPPPDMFGGHMDQHSRMAERFLNDFDLNHDGKVTKDEFEKGIAQKYASLAGNAGGVTADAFLKSHAKDFRQHTDEMFRRADWNNDGRLSLEEFSIAPRARFMMMDRDGAGVISCAPHQDSEHEPEMTRGPRSRMSYRGMGGWHQLGERCQEADQNKDGKVTRAEVDKTIAEKFAEAARGGNSISQEQFFQFEQARFHDIGAKRFDRIDSDHNGKLSKAEFAAPAEKMFDRLDRNHDGVIAPDELQPRHGMHGDWHKGPGPK